MSWALVTGATAGLGAAFAEALATRGHDLVLVARDEARLATSADALRAAHRIEVETLAADLAVRTDVDTVVHRIEDASRPVEVLVNNAGFGLTSDLLDPATDEHERAIGVMCTAVVLLGGAAGRAMRARGRGAIINVGSLSGWIAQGAYSAVKAFVFAYSEGLANELHGTGVRLTVVCPGWVRTEFHRRAGIKTTSIPDAIWVEADRVVAQVLSDSDKGVVVSVPTRRWKLAKFAIRHLPRGVVRTISRRLGESRR